MASFIKIEDNYNPLTLQGSGHRLINVDYIIHITDISKRDSVDNVRARVKSRVLLSTGEHIDTVHSVEDIGNMVKKQDAKAGVVHK
tara:strand:- start:387 stop:644 length:258 start_codon:yes stop_codon:yes gene_type:complete